MHEISNKEVIVLLVKDFWLQTGEVTNVAANRRIKWVWIAWEGEHSSKMALSNAEGLKNIIVWE